MKRRVATIRAWGLPAQLLFLAAVVLAVYALVAPLAGRATGVAGLAASATAAALCWLGAATALVISRAFRDPERTLYGVLYGTLLRMFIPLFAALALQLSVAALAEAYLLVYFLVFYPVTLFVETTLSLPQADAPDGRKDVSPEVAT
ncbi:MAG TPA: hypothetical protein VMY37_27470 [Thermoguttaceae bacterium]|nr:hypothetical protein [Thermoguttaceae bacterium]